MATKQYIYSSSNITNDKLIAGTGGLTVQEVTVGSGLTLTAGTLTAPNLIPLTTTFANCENTATEIDVVTVTVPANTLAVGDVIDIIYRFQRLQNSGATINITARNKANGSQIGTTGLIGVTNNGVTNIAMQKTRYIVTQVSFGTATIVTPTLPTGNSNSSAETNSILINASTVAIVNGEITTGLTTNISNTLSISLQWATANVNSWVRVQQHKHT